LFGAKVGKGVLVYPSASIWAPWNLVLKDFSQVGPHTDIYCVDKIILEENAWISQYSYLCTASHAINDPGKKLIMRPIHIGRNAWIAADAFIGPGVNVGEEAVVGARASVFKDVKPWSVVGGNPAKVINIKRKRRFRG
jgi:putative colanic acid biosynthesis acetyltransferase WcaF